MFLFTLFGKQKIKIISQEFQEFINGPTGPRFLLNALMNIYRKIDVTLMTGQTAYQIVFTKHF